MKKPKRRFSPADEVPCALQPAGAAVPVMTGSAACAHEIKALQTRLSESRAEESACQERLERAQQAHQAARAHRTNLEARLRELTAQAQVTGPVVSEHALLRYLERFKGVDLDAIRREILSEKAVGLIAFARTGKIDVDGRRLIVKNGAVVSIAHAD